MKTIFALLFAISASAANLDPFFAALGKVESSGNSKAINKKERKKVFHIIYCFII